MVDLRACSPAPTTPTLSRGGELLYPQSGVPDGYWAFEGPFGSTRGT